MALPSRANSGRNRPRATGNANRLLNVEPPGGSPVPRARVKFAENDCCDLSGSRQPHRAPHDTIYGTRRTHRLNSMIDPKVTIRFAIVSGLLFTTTALAELPDGYWSQEQSQPILDTTLRVTLDPDLSSLTDGEKNAVAELIAAGKVINDLYELQLQEQSFAAKQALLELHAATNQSPATRNLIDLWHLARGPIVTTLDNKRLAFVPVTAERPGRNFYPTDLTREEFSGYLEQNPGDAALLLDLRSVVRRASKENLSADIKRLGDFPEVDALHIGLRERLESMEADRTRLYAVPYALAYAPRLREARRHLNAAADFVQQETPDFAAYLRNRARDLLSSDYESGDASWVSGDFGGLNVAFGSYETYDDKLRGVKASYGVSVLARDDEASRALESAITGLQAIEDSLPYEHHKTVRSRIPVGVYNVIADFGQSRGGNTATILPNDADHTRKYGRTILLRYNIMMHPDIFNSRKKRFDAAIDACCRDHLTSEGGFNRTLWHEIGHYLGVSKTADGQDLGSALANHADLLEEMKSDLVSLYAAPALSAMEYYDDDALRAHYADGIRRTLQITQPRPEQPYQNMQLMQFNYYLERGLVVADDTSGLLRIDYERYHEVVTELLQRVLQLQYEGDYELAQRFVERWNYWEEDLHGKLAERMLATNATRYTLVSFEALRE